MSPRIDCPTSTFSKIKHRLLMQASALKPAAVLAAALLAADTTALAEFKIDMTFDPRLSELQKTATRNAVKFWESKILDYAGGSGTLNGFSVDVNWDFAYTGYLAFAGPRSFDTQNGIIYTTSGSVTINTLYYGTGDYSDGNGSLEATLQHEFAHVLGIGTLWPMNDLVNSSETQYTGKYALNTWRDEFGQTDATFVPLETKGGGGTAGGHWAENLTEFPGGGLMPSPTGIISKYTGGDFADELMTGVASAKIFTSSVTFAAIKDLGYDLRTPTDTDGNYLIESGAYYTTMTGDGRMRKTTSALAALFIDNDYTGGSTIEAGRLVVGSAGALGFGALTIQGDSTVDVGAINVEGTTVLTLDAGHIVGTTGSITAAAINLRSGTVAATLAGPATLTKQSGGMATLESSNTYAGGTRVLDGTLVVKHAQALGTGAVEITGGTLDINTVTLTGIPSLILNGGAIAGTGALDLPVIDARSGSLDIALRGTLAITKTTAGTLNLNGDNSFTGGIAIDGGIVVAGGVNSLGAGKVTFNGGQLLIRHAQAAALTSLDLNTGSVEFDPSLRAATIGEITGANAAGQVIDLTANGGAFALTLGTNNTSVDFAGSFTGSGSFTKGGTGEYILESASDHTGGTAVANGTLRIKNAAALGSGNITVTGGKLDLGDTTLVTGAKLAVAGGAVAATTGTITAGAYEFSAGNIAASIGGDAGVLKTGDGTATVSGVNTYKGGTQVDQGTLVVTNAKALGAGGVVVNGGTLDIEATVSGIASLTLKSGNLIGRIGTLSAAGYELQSGTVSGRLAGSANVVKTTSGIVTLARDNSFAGTVLVHQGTLAITNPFALGKAVTTVNAGATLQVGADSAFPAAWVGSEIKLANQGTLDVRLASATTINRTITGAGAITLSGDGEIGFTAATHTGGTTVDAGTLVLGDTTRLPGNIVVNDFGTVAIRAAATPMEVANNIGGTGAVSIGGTGETRLTGNIATTGTLEILSGAHATLGSPETATAPASPATLANRLTYIRQNAFLGGVGSFSGTVVNEGTLAPGFSPGAITIAGDFVNTGTLRMEIGATGEHDEIRFDGQAFLSGHLQIVYLGATPAKGTILTLLTDTNTVANQPSILGNFSQVSIVGATNGISFVNGAELKFVVDGTIFDIPGAALPQSARLGDFAQALYALSQSDTTVAAVASPFAVSGANLAATYRAASPLGYAAAAAMPVEQAQAEADNLYRHLQSRRYERPSSWLMDYSPYVEAGGVSATADSGKDGRAFDHTSVGGSVGADLEPAQDLLIGAKVGYDAGKAKFHHGAGELAQDHMRVAVYASQLIDTRYFVDASLALGYSLYDSKHNTPLGRQKADSTGWDVSASVNAGFVAPISASLSLTPHIGLVATRTQTSGFKEDGSPLALNLDGIDQNSLATRAGVGLNQLTRIGDTRVRLTLDASWMHELLDEEVDIGGDIAGHGFTTSAVAGIKDRLQVGPGADFLLDDNRAISVDYKFDYAFGDATAHRLDISYRTRF